MWTFNYFVRLGEENEDPNIERQQRKQNCDKFLLEKFHFPSDDNAR